MALMLEACLNATMLKVATHSGPFHADDVLAYALLCVFETEPLQLTRTRDRKVLAEQDLVFDVGHEFDEARGRFDHHQRDYEGDKSSAGLVLDHLESRALLTSELAVYLRTSLVGYVDAVDIGAREPEEGVPCFSMMMGVLNELAEPADGGKGAAEGFDTMYRQAARYAELMVRALVASFEKARKARDLVEGAMKQAEQNGHRTLRLSRYLKWKPAYFELGGAEHATDYVLFQAGQDDWRVVTIPVEANSREDKRKLPESWAGLEGAELERVVGVKGANFCHRNRFIAGFASEQAALEALRKWDRE